MVFIKKLINKIYRTIKIVYSIYEIWFGVKQAETIVVKLKKEEFSTKLLLEIKNLSTPFASLSIIESIKKEVSKLFIKTPNVELLAFIKNNESAKTTFVLHKKLHIIEEMYDELRVILEKSLANKEIKTFDLFLLVTKKAYEFEYATKRLEHTIEILYKSNVNLYVEYYPNVIIEDILIQLGLLVNFEYKALHSKYRVLVTVIYANNSYKVRKEHRLIDFNPNEPKQTDSKIVYLPLKLLQNYNFFFDPFLENINVKNFIHDSSADIQEPFNYYNSEHVSLFSLCVEIIDMESIELNKNFKKY